MARCNGRDEDIRDTLCRNLGRMCTIFTNTGGRGGDGFTGVLSDVDNNSCRLVSLEPADFSGPDRNRGRRRGCGCRGVGSVQTIPLDKINCVETSQF